jgi:hypothetical protein
LSIYIHELVPIERKGKVGLGGVDIEIERAEAASGFVVDEEAMEEWCLGSGCAEFQSTDDGENTASKPRTAKASTWRHPPRSRLIPYFDCRL